MTTKTELRTRLLTYLRKYFRVYNPYPGEEDQTIDAILTLLEDTVREVIGKDFDLEKIPFGPAQIEAVVANRLMNEQRQRWIELKEKRL